MTFSSNTKRIDRLIEHFLKGYGEIPEVQLPVILICEAMQRVVSLWGNVSKPLHHFHHKFEIKRRIQNHVEWLTNENAKPILLPSALSRISS
ncbi:MAG: hypothetical protein ACFE9R_15955 [Candidatus Hermodarchaeota archaeon]